MKHVHQFTPVNIANPITGPIATCVCMCGGVKIIKLNWPKDEVVRY